MPILSRSDELVADLEGDVRSSLGKAYVDGAKRYLCVTDVKHSIQEEEEEEGLAADRGMLGLLVQINTGTAGGGASKSSMGHF